MGSPFATVHLSGTCRGCAPYWSQSRSHPLPGRALRSNVPRGMKIRSLGSRSSWSSNQSFRFFRTSCRSCSTAWPVFFSASDRDGRRTAKVTCWTQLSHAWKAPGVTLRARCPESHPELQGSRPRGLLSDGNGRHRLGALVHTSQCGADYCPIGSPMSMTHHSAERRNACSCQRQSLQSRAPEDP